MFIFFLIVCVFVFFIQYTTSVSNALDEAATALNRMRSKQGNNGGGEEHQKAAQLEASATDYILPHILCTHATCL